MTTLPLAAPDRLPPSIDPGSPAFTPFARWLPAFGPDALHVPPVAQIDALARDARLALPDGRPLRFVSPSAPRPTALGYERRIAERAEVATRDRDVHDGCNALAWLAFPRTKAALNARHVAAGRAPTGNGRDRVRDGATLLDESGLLFVCADSGLVEGLRGHRWRATFGERRDDVVRRVRVFVVGHGLLAKLFAPYPALTAKALWVPLEPSELPAGEAGLVMVDDAAARIVASGTFTSASLMPLPVAALPGWPGDDGSNSRFDDETVFRPPGHGRYARLFESAATAAGSADGTSTSTSASASSSALP